MTISFTGQDIGVVSLDWTIQGVADFNPVFNKLGGVSTADVLWRNDNGDVAYWGLPINTLDQLTNVDIGLVSSDWRIEGTGKFHGTRAQDIMWRNTNGDLALW